MATDLQEKPTGLTLALEMSKPPDSLIGNPKKEREELKRRKEYLERKVNPEDRMIGQTTEDYELKNLGREEYDELQDLRAEFGEIDRPKKQKPEQKKETEPETKPSKSEDEKARKKWRKANSEFHPYKLLGERLKDKEEKPGDGAKIMQLFDDAMKKADLFEYDEAIGLLLKATEVGKQAQKVIDVARQQIAEETKKDEERHKEVFSVYVLVQDKEYGFDTDTDAQNFYLANTIVDGGVGTLEKSKKLKDMEEIIGKCAERKQKLQAAGATIDEIVSVVYKDVPEAFWPDDVVKEVALYKAVTAEIAMEKEIEEQFGLAQLGEKTEAVESVLDVAEDSIKWAKKIFGEDNEKFQQAMEIMESFTNGIGIANSLLGSGASGLDSGEKSDERKEAEDNPVKEKVLEFQRNKAIVTCVNGLAGLGLSEAANYVPVVKAVVKGKDALLAIFEAGHYFRSTLKLSTLEKGAKVDPRSAALLPLARLAREQKIALSDAAFKVVSAALQSTGEGLKLGVVTAPAGLILDATGTALSYGGKIIVAGINWSDAGKAAKLIQQAAGPPPLRRAQIEVMKYSSKYAKVAIVHMAMKEHDAWAIGHLENMGLEREDIDHPKTSSKLIREYMALKAGGMLGSEQGEEQQEFGESLLGKAGKKIAEGAEWIRDKVVGRDTKIKYDPSWRADSHDLTVADWKSAKDGAIAAGWYDSRPAIEMELAAYDEAVTAYNRANSSDIDATIAASSELYAALSSLQTEINAIKAVTNDKKTEHAGMKAFLLDWWKLAGIRMDTAAKTRSEYIDKKAFPNLSGEALANAKKEMLDKAVKKAKEDQALKVAARKKLIAQLWDAYEIKTPYKTCKLLDFPKKMEGGAFTFGTVGSLDFDETEVNELAVEVAELRKSILERLNTELVASTETDLRKDFKASALTAERRVVEGLRASCERLYEAKLKREGKTSEKLWTPKPNDIVLDWEQWRKVIDAAKSGGWDQEENTGFTELLKTFQKARDAFVAENKKDEPNKTIVEQQRGIILGSLDELEQKLHKFKPVTELKFYHPGLIVYRDGMIELCLAERIKFDSGT